MRIKLSVQLAQFNTNFSELYKLHEVSFLLNDKEEIRVIRTIR